MRGDNSCLGIGLGRDKEKDGRKSLGCTNFFCKKNFTLIEGKCEHKDGQWASSLSNKGEIWSLYSQTKSPFMYRALESDWKNSGAQD